MRCPHCNIGINFRTETTTAWEDAEDMDTGYRLAYGHCPECEQMIVVLERGELAIRKTDFHVGLEVVTSEEVIYPVHYTRPVESEVPKRYKTDYIEACSVLPLSSKASAALSRRLLQTILREHFDIKKPDLAKEIEEFINQKDVPSYLAAAVDAVRNIGNFAAHPLKNTNTGEIADVEPGEAEWLLEVLESLFDYAFVQPARLEAKKKQLNSKLQALGKPPMQEPPKN